MSELTICTSFHMNSKSHLIQKLPDMSKLANSTFYSSKKKVTSDHRSDSIQGTDYIANDYVILFSCLLSQELKI